MLKVGKTTKMKVISKIVEEECFLLENKQGDQIKLPADKAGHSQIGDIIEVFIYCDHERNLIPTLKKPLGLLGEFVVLDCVDVTASGAYMDFGIEKDLFVPRSMQPDPMELDEYYIVKICQDDATGRLYGNAHIEKQLETEEVELHEKQSVTLVPYDETELGYKVIVDDLYQGMIYHNEIFQELGYGARVKGTVIKVREDGKVDCLVGRTGPKAITDNRDVILEALKENNGFISLHDKSTPDEIKLVLGMSKQAFKKAIGNLYKEKVIKLEKNGIKLI